MTVINSAMATSAKVIYDQDNRQDVSLFPDNYYRQAALSVAGKVRSFSLTSSVDEPGQLNFKHTTLQSFANLCPDERFAQQLTLPTCTGFLVADDVLVTAGHCMTGEMDCNTSTWVFDYVEGTNSIPSKNAYNCKKIIQSELVSSWYKMRDYAVVQLDRKVTTERQALTFRQDHSVSVGTPLVVIGHPSGLPLKIADGAKVKIANWTEFFTPIRSIIRKKYYFLGDLDTFGGNSGSPVFNQTTGMVEGILVQGAEDYVADNSGRACYVAARRVSKKFNSMEKVYRITKINNLKKIVEDAEAR
jgi:V8-like Glu-specific endopeptidase